MNALVVPLPRNRENTRARLIAAGRALFYEREYNAISVELIAREAGFTRAAFYLHFNGKDDLLAAMMIAESHKADARYRWFEHSPPSPESIEGFIRANMRAGAEAPAVRLFHLAALQCDAARAAFQENRLRLMALLGASFPAFQPARDGSLEEGRRVARALFAMIQIEQLALRQDELADPELIERMVEALRDMLVALHAAYPR
jgi:AcrR family transcriptional regulator